MLPGCATDPTKAAYADEIAEAKTELATSPQAQKVLEDGRITEQEVEELRAWVQNCIVDAGWPGATVDTQKGNTIPMPEATGKEQPELNAKMETDIKRCETEVGWPRIQSLYNSMRTNPLNEDFDKLMAECLLRHGVVAAPYTGQDHKAAMDKYHQKMKDENTNIFVLNEALPIIMSDLKQAEKQYFDCSDEPLK